ncbi:hypothetical protein ABFS83_03G094000 [Erythranthe nasuta]
MADQEEEDFKLALRLSMQHHDSPEPENSNSGDGNEAADVKFRGLEDEGEIKGASLEKIDGESGISGTELSLTEANQLFLMIFGDGVSPNVLAQWTNQGIRFSEDPETSVGLVQHEGGPCGVLAAIQAFVLKYLLFAPEESDNAVSNNLSNSDTRKVPENECLVTDILQSLSEEEKSRSLVRSMSEILFLCGRSETAVIASLNILDCDLLESEKGSVDEVIAKALESLSVESGSDLQKVLRVSTCTSLSSAIQNLENVLPIFRSRMGALLFLISALLSRGLKTVQEDRDDPSQPLVTAPFGHASQEIVNLLLSGSAVANVFDGNMDLGGGMFLKGISTNVKIGFLTLLESLNYCKVGQYLKNPCFPIWVVGSESHYTVLFAPDSKIQEQNELEEREAHIRRAFDAKDESGGGGFVSIEGFNQVIEETGIKLTREKTERLCGTGFAVWSEFWKVLLDLDNSLGGVKDYGSSGLMGEKVFDLYHFNGIAKSIGSSGNENSLIQRPRLTRLRVSVPPKWTSEELSADVADRYGPHLDQSGSDKCTSRVSEARLAQHAPLVDCVRTRWSDALCNWEGDAPSIV